MWVHVRQESILHQYLLCICIIQRVHWFVNLKDVCLQAREHAALRVPCMYLMWSCCMRIRQDGQGRTIIKAGNRRQRPSLLYIFKWPRHRLAPTISQRPNQNICIRNIYPMEKVIYSPECYVNTTVWQS